MNQVLLQTLIGTAGVIIGAFLTLLASFLTARQRIKEINTSHKNELEKLKLSYKQKLDENILANARQFKEEIYFPLNNYLSKLAEEFDNFRVRETEGNGSAKEEFRTACNEFVEQISGLNDALLISELDDRLRSFTQFIKASTYYEDVRQEAMWMPNFDDVFKGDPRVPRIRTRAGTRNRRQLWHFLQQLFYVPRIRRAGTRNRQQMRPVEIQPLRAPIYSSEFKNRFSKDIKDLKFLIKSVTIGTMSPK